ncbi:MAG: M14 family metallopeptidase [Opitutus sp.]
MCCAFSHSAFEDPQQFLPRELPWSGASESLIAPPDHPWITPGEKTGLSDSPSYDDTVAYLKRLCAEVPIFSLHEFGRTAQGRILYFVMATKERWHTPEALAAGGKPTLLAQSGIHSGEIEGKDAGLMLLRDIAFGGKAHLLDAANVLFIPVLNADGHERSSEWTRPNQRGPVHMGWRTTAQNLNLNRDFVKADAPEMRALLALLDRWQPSLYLDLHVTDGIDYQYDVTYTFHGVRGSYAYSPKGGAWLDQVLSPALHAALKAKGHCPIDIYIDPANGRDLDEGLIEGHSLPRFSQGYGDARSIPTVLIETHSLKSHRQRVLGVYVLLESALSVLGQRGHEVLAAIAADRAARPASLPTGWTPSQQTQAVEFLGVAYEHYRSPASGGMEVRWTGELKSYPALLISGDQPKAMMSRPKAYWVPVSKPAVIDRLRLHGIVCETLTRAQTAELEFYRLLSPKPRLSDGFHPFEGRHTLSFETSVEQRREPFPIGSVRVSTDQPLGTLATIMLQPESEDSLVAWGFFSEILQRTEYIEGYVAAPMGEHLLERDPKMKAEFEAKLVADPSFANDPKARLSWFYRRSPFFDDRYLLYPVGIER